MLIPQYPSVPVDVAAAIRARAKDLNAIILAHYYQEAAIQDVADFVGDSLQLARQAAATKAAVIVFCGVHFMAETAKIMSPQARVLLPDLAAGCSLSESAPAGPFADFVAAHPGHTVVTYVNSSAAVKALSDYCCTSSNACDVVNAIPVDKPIIFAPDKYLGDWVAKKTGRKLVLWDGACEVHATFSAQGIADLCRSEPTAQVLVHPESPAPVIALAHVVGSTKQLLEAVRRGDPQGRYIVVTEPGIIHQMRRVAPAATFIEAPGGSTQQGSCTNCNTCPHMRRNTLVKLYQTLMTGSPEIVLDPVLAARARLPIERMIAIGS